MNNKLTIGKKYDIHGYKHNKKLHRTWNEAVLLDIEEEYLVFGNKETTVKESDGRIWKTKEPAVLFFYYDNWFNIIGQCKKKGIFYYCNIASPFIIEENTIKYIDYDLDLRVFPDGSFKILDYREYNYHKKLMNYPKKIDVILKSELNDLIKKVKSKKEPFRHDKIEFYKEKYLEIIKK